ncbi:antigen peptide transporter 1 [Aplochiton taeniatus]
MQKMSYISPLLFLCLDFCVVHAIRLAQLSPLLLTHPFLTLWGGGLTRLCLLLLLTFTYPGSLPWMRSFEGFQSIGVLCLHCPVYISLLWACGWPTTNQLWGWHTWQGLLQSYGVAVVALLYWNRYVPSLSTSHTPEKVQKKNGASLTRLLSYMKPFSKRFAMVLSLVVISSLGEMAIPHYTGKMTDWIMNEDAPEAFSQAIIVMTVITISSAVCEFVCDLMYNVTMSRIHTSFQGLVFRAVLKQEIAFFDNTQTGQIVSRITTDTNKMSESLSEELSLLMWYSARVFFLFIFMINLTWKLSLFTLMGLPIIWVIPKFSGHFYQTISAKVQESLAKANHVATETFSSMKTVRSFANEEGETERYRLRLEDTYALNKKEAAAYAASTWTNSMSTLALKVSILFYGGVLVTGDTVSNGDLVSFVLYELQFSSAIQALISYYPEVRKAIGASEKIFEYLDRKPQVPQKGTLAPETLKGHVQLKNVTFAYPTKKDTVVIKDLSLEIKPGKITALVGQCGSGKTTVVSLLERFYQPQAGEILLDGEPLDNYQDRYLHEKISVVGQEPVLFARSVKENIKYGCEDASDEEMYEAAKRANAHKFIFELPHGYETDAGQKGGQVSGGQKQRIAIARALLRKPQILVLDSVTSCLDTECEYLVLQELLNDRTCSVLLIAQKMSAVEKAHHIVVLKDGMVHEEGCHEELIKKGGLYAELVKEQNTSFQRK